MAVWSDGSYGAPKDVMFSFPVTCESGTYKIVQGLQLSANTQALLKVTGEELLAEKKDAGISGAPAEGTPALTKPGETGGRGECKRMLTCQCSTQ